MAQVMGEGAPQPQITEWSLHTVYTRQT